MTRDGETIRWARALPLATALLLAAALLGCGAGDSAGGPAGATAETDDDRAAEFSLTSLDGETWRLAESAGSVRLIDFWATWCAPCRDEVPMLNELQRRYGAEGFMVVAISDADDPADRVREFVDELGVEYLTLLGEREVFDEYDVFGLPTAYLLDRDGTVIETYFGRKPDKALESKIRGLLGLPEAT